MTRANATLAGTTCYVSLGSNVGERERQVLEAVARIESSGAGRVRRISGLYETDPVGMPGARAFINAVVELETPLSPDQLLERLQGIEIRMGRTGGHYRPREIDIDIIAFGAHVIDEPHLNLPHPRYVDRAFVLVPLRDVAPDFVCPQRSTALSAMPASTPGGGVTRVSGRAVVSRVGDE